MRRNNQALTEANQANQANNAVLARRLQLVEQGVLATPMGSSSGISRLTPQAPPSVAMNQTEVSTPLASGPPKRMRVRETLDPSAVRLRNLQQSDTDLLASIQQGDDAPTDEMMQVMCDPLEESKAPPAKLPSLDPEPTNITPFPKDDHDDDGDPGGLSSQPRVQDQSSLQVGGHVSEQSNAMPKGEKGNSTTNEMVLAYEFGAVALLNHSDSGNKPEKLPTTTSSSHNSTQKPFDSGGGSVGGNGGHGGDGGNGDGGNSNKGSNDSSGSSRVSSNSGGDHGGSGGGTGGGSSEPSDKVWKSIPCDDGMRRFLALLEAQLVKQRWSKTVIWRTLVHVKDQWVFPRGVNAAL